MLQDRSLSLWLSLSLSLSLSLHSSISLSLYRYLSIYLSLSLSLSLHLSTNIYLSIYLFLSFSLPIFLSFSLSLSIYLSISSTSTFLLAGPQKYLLVYCIICCMYTSFNSFHMNNTFFSFFYQFLCYRPFRKRLRTSTSPPNFSMFVSRFSALPRCILKGAQL